MAERSTLLARPSNAPTTQPTQTGAVQGAFGDYRGLAAFGQGLTSAGAAGMDYATRVKSEYEQRRVQDHQLKVHGLVKSAVKGVRQKFETLRNSGQRIDDPMAWMDQEVTSARAELDVLTDGAKDDPLFQRAVPAEALKNQWDDATSRLYDMASSYDGEIRMEDRRSNAATLVETAFGDTEMGNHEQVLQELNTQRAIIDKLYIPGSDKHTHRRRLADRAYQMVLGGIERGIRAPDSIADNAAFDPDQRRMMASLNRKLDQPAEIKPAEATKVLDSSLETAEKTGDLTAFAGQGGQTMQLMADAVSAAATTPEAKRYPYARIELTKKLVELTRNNFNDGALKGSKLYQRLTNLSTMLNDTKSADTLYESMGITGAHGDDRSRFMTSVKAKVEEQLALINTGKANMLIDRSDAVAPIASAVTAEFNMGALSSESARLYSTAARQQYKELGIPENLQVLVPAAIASTVIDRVWNGDNGNAMKMMTDIGRSFGSDALGSVANHFLAPTTVQKTGAGVDGTKARAGAYAALFKIAAADQSRVEGGASGLELQDVLKDTLDNLSNYEKNSHTFTRRSQIAAESVFNNTAFDDPANAKEIVSGDQLTRITSKAQSLQGIAVGLMWQHGQNNDLATGFKEMAMRVIQSKAYSAGVQADGTDEFAREKLASAAGDNLNRMLARIYTVVPSQGMENQRQVVDLWPTKLVDEGTFALPKLYGANDAAVLSTNLSRALSMVGYYEPRKEQDRGFQGNYATAFKNIYWRDNPFIAGFLREGSEAVKALPPHLAIDWASVAGITPEQAMSPGRTTGDLFKDYVNKPETRATMNSLAFSQNGAWRYNWKTGWVEAMIFPARSTSAASPSIETPGAAQVLRHTSGAPVAIKGEDLRKFEAAYRFRRTGLGWERPATESQFVTPPLN